MRGVLSRRNDVADRRPSSGLGCQVDDIRAWIDAHPIEASLGQGSVYEPGGAVRSDAGRIPDWPDQDASRADQAEDAPAQRGAVIDWEVAETQVRGIHLCLAVTPEVILDALAVNANVIVSRRAVFASDACCGTQNAMMANAKWAAILSRHSLSCVSVRERVGACSGDHATVSSPEDDADATFILGEWADGLRRAFPGVTVTV